MGFAGGLRVSSAGRGWSAYISSVAGFILTVSERRLFKAGGSETCGRPLGLAHGLRAQADDDAPNSDPRSATQAKQKQERKGSGQTSRGCGGGSN